MLIKLALCLKTVVFLTAQKSRCRRRRKDIHPQSYTAVRHFGLRCIYHQGSAWTMKTGAYNEQYALQIENSWHFGLSCIVQSWHLIYGIRDQLSFGDLGSKFGLKYENSNQCVFWIRILATGSGSQPHKIFRDQWSESNENWGSGTKFLVKKPDHK